MDGVLALKARGDMATAALRSLLEAGQLDQAPPRLRDEIAEAASALAAIINAADQESVVLAGERVLDKARAWLTSRSTSAMQAADGR